MTSSRNWGLPEVAKEYRTIREIAGPLIFVEKTEYVGYGELVEVGLPDGTRKRGQVLDSSKDIVVVQGFEGTAGSDRQRTGKCLRGVGGCGRVRCAARGRGGVARAPGARRRGAPPPGPPRPRGGGRGFCPPRQG